MLKSVQLIFNMMLRSDRYAWVDCSMSCCLIHLPFLNIFSKLIKNPVSYGVEIFFGVLKINEGFPPTSMNNLSSLPLPCLIFTKFFTACSWLYFNGYALPTRSAWCTISSSSSSDTPPLVYLDLPGRSSPPSSSPSRSSTPGSHFTLFSESMSFALA